MKRPSNVSRKAVISWCMFDWANSAFPTLVLTFVFATYFTKSVAKTDIIGTSEWGNAVALAGFLVAIFSPIFGAIADNEGRRKPWLALFTLLCILASAMLWFTQPNVASVEWALFWLVVGIIGFEVGMVFYNSMLSDLVDKEYLGRLSGWGWGVGYFGGLISLILMLFVIKVNTNTEIRFTGPFVALWFLAFAWPLFVWTPDQRSTGIPYRQAISKGINSIYQTIKKAKDHKQVFLFLIARILYIDGLNTIFAFGGIYAAGTFGMSFAEVVKFGIAMNVAAGVGAIVFAWMDDLRGSKRTLLVTLALMTVCVIAILLVHSKLYFWLFGMGVSICVGPVQAASRSLLIRLSPKEIITEMFGLYAFSGKATSFLGPWVLAMLTSYSQSQRIGFSSILLFLLIGFLILLNVKEPNR